jgi:transposase-like protein
MNTLVTCNHCGSGYMTHTATHSELIVYTCEKCRQPRFERNNNTNRARLEVFLMNQAIIQALKKPPK